MTVTTESELVTPLTLAIVTRTFWPLSGACELAIVDLAAELQRQGHQVDVTTIRWRRNWPSQLQLCGVPVTRLARPRQTAWGNFRFQRQLVRALASQANLDGVIVFGLSDESLGQARELRKLPVIIRADYRQTAYPHWTQLRNKKSLTALERAAAVVVDSEYSAVKLNTYGLSGDRIHVIPDGVVPNPATVRSTTEQVNARMALSNAHPILSIEPGHPLVVCGSPLDDDGGVLDLIDAWKSVMQVMPQAKLWLLGDGSHGAQIWQRICALDLVYSVIMPGYFDQLQPVFAAADLYVHPLRTERSCSLLVRAMNNGLCPVAVESNFTQKLVTRSATGLVTVAGNPKAIAEALIHGLENRDLRRRLGNAARASVAKSHSLEEQVKKYVRLITQQPQTIPTSPL